MGPSQDGCSAVHCCCKTFVTASTCAVARLCQYQGWLMAVFNFYFRPYTVTRLTPQNAHQQPRVVVLCGNHYQGALGVNCARQLAQHDLRVLLYLVKSRPTDNMVAEELELYDLTHGDRTNLSHGQ